MNGRQEALSYLVTIVGLPFAIGVYVYDRRRDRQNDEEESGGPTNTPTCICRRPP